jgi:hypothetical protein
MKVYDVPVQKIPLDVDVRVKIAQFYNLELIIIIPAFGRMEDDYEIFMKQIQKYAETVQGTPHYPEKSEVFLMRNCELTIYLFILFLSV